MHNELITFINKSDVNAKATLIENEAGDKIIGMNAEAIKKVCFALRDSSEYQFNVLQVISGVDYADRIEVNYMIASFIKNTEFILKVKLPKKSATDMPNIESICDVWKSANFLEREVFDLLGVTFDNHPDLRRILCPDDWTGFPLRKDYIVQEVYNGMEVNPAHKINQGDFDFLTKAKLEASNPKFITGSWDGNVSKELSQALERKMATIQDSKTE